MSGKIADTIVIGGGAAGMMAAIAASERFLNVVLVEKNKILGKKLLITGKGRCNLTNNCDIGQLFANIPKNSKFLYSAFDSFSNTDLIKFMSDIGVPTKVERGARVFPQSDKASEVVAAMRNKLLKNNVSILHQKVSDVTKNDGVWTVCLDDKNKLRGLSVIIATGGMSYPATGCTGDGYIFANHLGHTVTSLKPALVPIETVEKWTSSLQGLSLKNTALTAFTYHGQSCCESGVLASKKVYTDFGEMIFTHYGISGPMVLSASSHVKKGDIIAIDLKPALSAEQLDARVRRDFQKYANKHLINALDDLMPQKLVPVIIELADINAHKVVNQITKNERGRLCGLLKNLTVTVKNFRPIEEAVITSGGIAVREINPSTMESKKIEGLYFAGEIIDVDGYTGGFNLQIAFSTGYLAGTHCIENGILW